MKWHDTDKILNKRNCLKMSNLYLKNLEICVLFWQQLSSQIINEAIWARSSRSSAIVSSFTPRGIRNYSKVFLKSNLPLFYLNYYLFEAESLSNNLGKKYTSKPSTNDCGIKLPILSGSYSQLQVSLCNIQIW